MLHVRCQTSPVVCLAFSLLATGPLLAAEEQRSAQVNPYRGMQERADECQFAEKPAVRKDGDNWVITFATTAACDATVSSE